MQKILIDSQKVTIFVSIFFVIANYAFFSRVFGFAWQEENYVVLTTTPLVLFFLFMFIFNILFLLTNKFLYKLILSILIFVFATSGYFMNTFGTIIDKNMIFNVVQTDPNEAFDLITFKLLMYIFCLGIFPILLLLKMKISFTSYKNEIINKLIVAAISFIFVVFSYFLLSKQYSPFFRNHGDLRFYINPTYPIYSFGKFVSLQIKSKQEIISIGNDAQRKSFPKKRLVVMILGETARAQNFELNGYSKSTNPLLSHNSDIINLNDVYSCGTATAVSVPCMFSKFGRDDYGDDKQNYENLVDVLNKTGVNVVWLDNNSGGSKGVADRIKNVKYYGGDNFDEVMFEDFKKSIENIKQDTFVVLHQQGSHGPTYYKRYPEKFKRFAPTCDTPEIDKCSKEEVVNTYDNTIVYTDYFINEIINILSKKQLESDTSLFYFSDHGESLGENGLYLHGLPYLVAPESQKHVPSIFWLGDSFKKEKDILNSKKNQHFSHDNIFHTVLGLFNVSTREYDIKLDMLK